MSHVQEIIMQKNMFDYPQKLILTFFVFLFVNENINAQFGLTFEKSHRRIKFFSCEWYLEKVALTKS
jgi:hypothetical protein